MTRNCLIALVFGVATLGLGAQQPNSADATMTINGAGGPPYPITNVTVFSGVTTTLTFTGSPGMPIDMGQSNLSVGNQTTPMGILDLDYANIGVILTGQQFIDGFGTRTISITTPQTLTANITRAFQAAVVAPASPYGQVLTAATAVVTAQGIVGGNLTLGGDTSVAVSFSPYQKQVYYYANTYSNMFVNSNGSVSFGSGNTDFTTTSGEFRAAQPRIAMFWSDLQPGANTVSWQIDLTQPLPLLKVDFANVGEAYGALGQHWFHMTMQMDSSTQPIGGFGDIQIVHPFNNPPANYDTIVGISPGSNLSSAQPQDLSALQDGTGYFGSANEAIYEFYSGTTSTTGIPGPNFDLTLRTLTFSGIGVGSTGAAYFMY